MGGVVGGDGVDGAVHQALDEGFAVLCAAKRGIHLEAAFFLEIVFAEHQVVGPRLTGDAYAAGFGGPDEFHALAGRDMAHVVTAAGFLAQLQVPLDLAPFAFGADALVAVGGAVSAFVDISSVQEGVVFAVGGQDDALPRGFLHGLPHHLGVLHSAAVVGERHASAFKGLEIHQLPAFAAHGDGAVGEDVNHGVAVNGRLLQGQMLQAVRHGVQVGHGAHQRIASSRGSQRPGADGLFPGLTRLAEVDMDVTECGQLYHMDKKKTTVNGCLNTTTNIRNDNGNTIKPADAGAVSYDGFFHCFLGLGKGTAFGENYQIILNNSYLTTWVKTGG